MCQVGVWVRTGPGTITAAGMPYPEGRLGQTIGHLREFVLIHVPEDATTVLAPEGSARRTRQPWQRPSRSRPRRKA